MNPPDIPLADAVQDAADRIAAVRLYAAHTRTDVYDATPRELLLQCLRDVEYLRDEQARRMYDAERAAIEALKGGAI